MSLAWNIEEGSGDGAYVEVQPPGGAWTPLDLSAVDPDATRTVLDGASATYRPVSLDLSPYAGQSVGLRIRYATDATGRGSDPSLPWSGVVVDDLRLDAQGTTTWSDDAEATPNGWTLSGFQQTGAVATVAYPQYYLASYRSYQGFDRYLRTGPYNYGWGLLNENKVEHFPYQDGLLVSYWDSSYADNNTSEHPGGGLVLPFDANPAPLRDADGRKWPGRIQAYDATFGRQRTDAFELRTLGTGKRVPSRPPVPVFDDRVEGRFFTPFRRVGEKSVGTRTAGAGVRIRVLRQTPTSMTVRVS
jgi:immune inhibitor A